MRRRKYPKPLKREAPTQDRGYFVGAGIKPIFDRALPKSQAAMEGETELHDPSGDERSTRALP